MFNFLVAIDHYVCVTCANNVIILMTSIHIYASGGTVLGLRTNDLMATCKRRECGYGRKCFVLQRFNHYHS